MSAHRLQLSILREPSSNYNVTQIHTPAETVPIFFDEIGNRDRECICVMSLDNQMKVIGTEVAVIGAQNCAYVAPCDIFRVPVAVFATKVILCHNHPSGDPFPSSDDCKITTQLCAAGELLGIDVLDHIILGWPEGKYTSMKDRGLIRNEGKLEIRWIDEKEN